MIDVQHHGPVRVLRLDIPERRNALSFRLLDQLTAAFNDLPGETAVTVVHGAPDFFSAGADLADLTGTTADTSFDDAVAGLRNAICGCDHPTVAAVDGYCLGAAVDVITAFDLVVANREATFGVPATRLGLLYDPTALERMAHRMRVGGLAHLLLTGETVDAQIARNVGLVDVLTTGPAHEHARQVADRIAANDLEAVNATTQVLRDLRRGQLDPSHWQERRRALMNRPERRRALAAARPKRETS